MSDPSVLAVLVTSYLVGLSGAVAPGPLLVYDLRESLRVGPLAGPLVSLGHALLELVVVALLALGLSYLVRREAALAAVGVVGGAFLLWMAWGMVRHPARELPGDARGGSKSRFPPPPEGKGILLPPSGGGIPSSASPQGSRLLRPVVGGVLVSLANPYWALWWLTAGASFLLWAQGIGTLGVALFYLGHIASDFSWYSLVAGATASGRRWITPRAYQTLMLACGLFLGAMGGWFLWSGLQAIGQGLF